MNMHYIATLIARDAACSVRLDLTAASIEDARELARRRGLALFRGAFTYVVRPA